MEEGTLIIDVILGVDIETTNWISNLQANMADQIIVLDYDYFGEPEIRDNILYLSTFDIKEHLMKFDTVNFYKSMYVYPGMSGNMTSLIKK